jgi:hypothetical protein
MTNPRRNFLRQAATAAGMLAYGRAAYPSTDQDQASGPSPSTVAKPNIFEAASAGDVPRATELANADPQVVRSRSADGRTPLHFAAAAGKQEMVVFLQSRGADLSARPESPLLVTVDFPDSDLATSMSRTLVANGSDPNVRRPDGRSALQLAAARGNAELSELLIHRGATVTGGEMAAATGDAVPVLRRAAETDRVHFDRRYIQDLHGKAVVRDDLNGLPWTLVNELASVAHRDFDRVKALLGEHPTLVNTRASWDESAIEAAAHMGLVPMAEWLADRGYAISTCTAVLLGLDGVVKQALAADRMAIYERGAHDITILAYATFGKEQASIAELLLKAGANVHARGLGITPLHMAASRGYLDLAELLIEHGADVNLPVKLRDGMVSPLALAVKAKQSKMEAFLKQRGARAAM